MIGYVILTGILAGIRPAFYLSSFHPAKVLKGTIQSNKAAVLSRKILVVLQFSCSIGLITGTLIVYRQLNYVQDRPVGYDRNRLLTTPLSNDLEKNYDAVKNELLQSGFVENVATASTPLTGIYNNTTLTNWPGKKEDEQPVRTGIIWVSPDYFKTAGMKLLYGRDFSSVPISDTNSVIVNEAAIQAMGLKEPFNQTIKFERNSTGHIIGVMGNALMRSPYEPIGPAIFTLHKNKSNIYNFIFYRLSPHANEQKAIAKINTIFDRYNPAYPFSYSFADDDYNKKFHLEVLVGKLAGIFSGIAVFISCLGLFGLAAFTAEQRKKEIGVRKVLGASVSQLWLLLCKDFLVLVLISGILASPIVFYFLQNWLQNYSYHVAIKPDVFFIAIATAAIITVATISYQAIRVAVANPVRSLRTE
jgi:ABC-type antimicrobial peptide transport system permease subunit